MPSLHIEPTDSMIGRDHSSCVVMIESAIDLQTKVIMQPAIPSAERHSVSGDLMSLLDLAPGK